MMNDRIFFSSKSDVFLFYNAGMAYFSNNLTELISAAISCKLFEGKKIYRFFLLHQMIIHNVQPAELSNSFSIHSKYIPECRCSYFLVQRLSTSPLPPKFQNPEKIGPSHCWHASWGSLRHDMVIFHIQWKFMS